MMDEASKNLEPSIKKMRENFSSLWIRSQTMKANWASTFMSSAAAWNPDASLNMVGQNLSRLGRNLQTFKANGEAAISSSVVIYNFYDFCRNVETLRANFHTNVETLKGNVRKNVEILTSNSGGPEANNSLSISSSSSDPSSPMFSFSSYMPRRLEEQTNPESSQPLLSSSIPPHSIFSYKTSSRDAFSEEDTPHLDHSSVSATTVCSIGSVGPPFLGFGESEHLESSQLNDVREDAQGSSCVAQETPWQLKDVRRFVEKPFIVYRKIRSIGFRESCWENKMPWRSPPPAYLAKGLQWPRTIFSSAREMREYHRRTRRRGRFLMAPIPGWSWFAADVLLLYFLINNPAGNFRI